MDPDPAPDPAIFAFDLLLIALKVLLHHFSKIKNHKKLQNRTGRNQGFSYYFCLMTEGSGSIPLTNGSRTGRPKNIWILRIRIPDTAENLCRKTSTNMQEMESHTQGIELPPPLKYISINHSTTFYFMDNFS